MDKMFRILRIRISDLFRISDFGFRILSGRYCLSFFIYSLVLISCLTFSTNAVAWTQTDWSGGDSQDGDSQCLWYAADRYDTGIAIDDDNPIGSVSMTDTGLVGLWHFNEGSGLTAYDATSNNNDGDLTGHAPTWGTVAEDTAVWGYGLSFDGIDDYVDCDDPTDGSLDFGVDKDFTVSVWFKTPSSWWAGMIYRALADKSSGSFYGNGSDALGYSIGVGSNGYLLAGLAGISTNNVFRISGLQLNTWYHAALVYDNDVGGYLYLNGSLGDTYSGTGGNNSNAYSLKIGTVGTRYFNGAIDEVRVYDRVLSADEIASHADTSIIQSLGDNSPRGVLLSSTFDADTSVVWKTIEWNNPSTSTAPYERGDSRLRKDETDGLVGLWHFDEGEDLAGGTSANDSTVYDESTNNNSGIVHGCVWGDASEDSAVFQNALSFDGTSACYVDCGNDVSLDNESAGTIEMWIYPTTLGGLFSRSLGGGWADERIVLHFYSSGDKLNLTLSNGISYWQHLSNSVVPVNTWTHVAVTWDGTNVKHYFNGTLDRSQAQGGTPEVTGVKTWIGRVQGLTPNYFHGAIDEVAIYSRAKTAEEIWQDARGTQMRFRTQTTSSILDGTGADSPVGLWHFDNQENSSTSIIAYDSSVYKNDGDFKGSGEPAWYQWGMFGKCVQFDGVDDNIALSSSYVFSANHSISMWIKPDELGDATYNSLFGRGAYAGYLRLHNHAETLSIEGETDTDSDRIVLRHDSIPFVEGNWYHIVITQGSSLDWKLYVNGEYMDSDTTSDANFTINYFGKGYVSHPWTGAIDEVGIYNYVLPAAQIKKYARGWTNWSPHYKKGDEDDIVLFADDFNDGVVGSDWTQADGTWLIDNITDDTGALKITSLTTGDTGIIQANNANWYNYQVETKVKLKANTQAGVLLNWNSTGSDNGYAALLDQGAGQIRLYAMDTNGVTTAAPLKTYTYTLTADTWYTLKAQYDGSRIRVYMGDKTYITSDALSHTYKGYAGLIAGNAEARFDDFKVFPIDRYCRYEATLTDNVVRDTTPYLYWVRLTYDDITSDESIWSRIIQDRHTYSDLTPRDTSITPAEFNYTDIDGADTVWCYNLENYGNKAAGETPTGVIKVNVATPTTASRVDLRLGIRKTSAINYPDEWPEDKDDYDWSDWRQYETGDGSESGDTKLWTLTYSTTNLATDFATEGGYVLQSRAVSSSEGTEPDPTSFQPNDDNDRRDTAIIYMMRDITPPGSSNTSGGWPGYVGTSDYQPVTGRDNNNWIGTGDARLKIKGIISYPEGAKDWYTNSEYIWINDSTQDDSGILVSVENKNPNSDRENDCSGLKELSSDDTPTRYVYSINAGTDWYSPEYGSPISITTIDDWSACDTDYDNITAGTRYLALGSDYSYLMPNLGTDASKGENILIQFAQKDKAGNWGYSHPSYSQIGQPTADAGYYINYDINLPKVEITAGPREANYSTSASFEFRDSAEDDSCAFRYKLEQGDAKDPFNVTDATYRTLTDYQPWLPSSRKDSNTYTGLATTGDNYYRCTIEARDEALNESDDADSATYVFQCLVPAPDTIIYSGAFGIITDDDGSYSAVFKYKGDGGNNTGYEYRYCTDGSSWSAWSTTAEYTYSVTSYGNYTFRAQARNATGDVEDPSPASVTFTIANPATPPAVAPPADPVKYWREESE